MRPSNRTDWRSIARITCPTLVVVGEHGFVGRELGRLLAQRLRRGELVVIPRAGHAVHLENLPATLAAVRPFLAAHVPDGAIPARRLLAEGRRGAR
jgi:pimeloyl-ACP methyl ester carboxylesterase